MDWKKEILEIIQQPVNNRAVYWYWGEDKSKSEFAKWLESHHGAMYSKGETYPYVYKKKYSGDDKKIVVIDISGNIKNKLYSDIHSVKAGIQGQNLFMSPHIIVFSNYPPDESSLSQDMWYIVNI